MRRVRGLCLLQEGLPHLKGLSVDGVSAAEKTSGGTDAHLLCDLFVIHAQLLLLLLSQRSGRALGLVLRLDAVLRVDVGEDGVERGEDGLKRRQR